MSLDAAELRYVLESADYVNVNLLWAAKTRDDLYYYAAHRVEVLGIWALPRHQGLDYRRAQVSLMAYMLGSTYALRLAEFRALDDLREPWGAA